MACISSSWLNYLLFSPLLLSSTENVNIWDCWGELAVFSYLLSVLDANLIWGYLTKNRICYLSLYPVDESAQGASTPAGCIMNNFLGLLLLGSHFCLYIGLPLFPLVVIITFFGWTNININLHPSVSLGCAPPCMLYLRIPWSDQS